MTRLRTVAAGAGALALVLTVTGCGGDSGLSAEEFRKQADTICKDFQDRSAEIFAGLSASSAKEDLEKAIGEVADLLDEQSEKIGELEPPEELADDVDAMLTSLREGTEKVRDDGLALLTSGENPLEDASAKAKDLELDSCGSVS